MTVIRGIWEKGRGFRDKPRGGVSRKTCLSYLRRETASLSSPTGNFCGTPATFVVFSLLNYGLWLSLVERLNGVQEVPGSNPGSPIFRRWGKLPQSEEVRGDCGVLKVLQFAGSSRWGWRRFSEDFLLAAKCWRGSANDFL